VDNKNILVCGFGWTGSGAVIDYLDGCSGFSPFRSRFEESSIFKGKYSLATVRKRLRSGQSVFEPEFVRNLMLALIGSSALVPGGLTAVDKVNIKRNELLRWDVGLGALAGATIALLERIFQYDEASDGFVCDERGFDSEVWNYINALADVRRKQIERPDDRLVFNNDPNAYNADVFDLVPDSNYVIVTRNLADVYATLVTLGKVRDSEQEALAFIKQHKKKIELFSAAIKALSDQVRRRVYFLSFEDFVQQPELRDRLDELLCLPADKASSFDPSVSIKNIGLRHRLSSPHVRRVEEVLETKRKKMLEHAKKVLGSNYLKLTEVA